MLSAAFWQQNMSCLLQAIEFSHSLLHFAKPARLEREAIKDMATSKYLYCFAALMYF
jgi:hypothetical protein